MTVKDLVRQVNQLYKTLDAADKGGEVFDKVVLKELRAVLKPLGKRTFNMRGLTTSQRQTLRNAGEKFLRSKGSTLEGARDIYNRKRENFEDRLRTTFGYVPTNYEAYEEAFRELKAQGAYESHGSSPSFDFLVDWVNNLMGGYDDTIDKIMQLQEDIYEVWKNHNNIERESAYAEVSTLLHDKE